MNRFDRYLRIVHWAQRRYRKPDGSITVSTGGTPSIYSRIELAAARKHLRLPAQLDPSK